MRIRRITGACLPVLLLLTACGEHATAPQLQPEAQLAKPDAGACVPDAEWVVDNADDLFTAMEGAQPGDVIAVDGVISTTFGAYTSITGITLTCATPGSGIVAAPDWDQSIGFMLRIFSHDVTVTNLFLDGGATPRGPLYALYDDDSAFARYLTFTGNTVVCGPGECIFLVGVLGSYIADNSFESEGGLSGIHVQGGGDRLPDGTSPYRTDATQVLRNIVTSTAPSPMSGFGGIRVRDGGNIRVSQNVVTGPWYNSLSPSDLWESAFDRNTLEGAQAFGIRLSSNAFTRVSTSNSMFRWNRVSGSGGAGAFVARACANILMGNTFRDVGEDVAVWFRPWSGWNLFLGNHNTVVDDGDFDCNEDGTTDPNVITGPGLKLTGLTPGVFARYWHTDHDDEEGEAELR
jgi:hypothetical protein